MPSFTAFYYIICSYFLNDAYFFKFFLNNFKHIILTVYSPTCSLSYYYILNWFICFPCCLYFIICIYFLNCAYFLKFFYFFFLISCTLLLYASVSKILLFFFNFFCFLSFILCTLLLYASVSKILLFFFKFFCICFLSFVYYYYMLVYLKWYILF